jgi:hypothetical protein
MPRNNPAPQFALLTSYDMRAFSGLEVFTRSGGSNVDLPTFASGEGVYEDALFFLNGRSSGISVYASGDLSTTSASFGSVWDVSINSSDKIIIQGTESFTIQSTGTDDPLGFGSSVVSSVLVDGWYIATAPNDWVRGLLDLTNVEYTIVGSSTFTFPSSLLHHQDVTVWLRGREVVDDADVFGLSSLEALDITAQSSSEISWSITDEGYTECHYLTSLGDITWTNTTIRNLLGFTGDETPSTTGSYSLLTSTHKNAGVLLPSRPYQQHHLRVNNVSQQRRKIGGGYTSNFIGSYVTSSLDFDLDALLDQVDDYRHFTERWLPLCSGGERVNFYQGWGDSRRALRTDQINTTQPAYDLLYTSEDNGSDGRVRASMLTTDFDLRYPGRLRRRVPVNMEMEHL